MHHGETAVRPGKLQQIGAAVSRHRLLVIGREGLAMGHAQRAKQADLLSFAERGELLGGRSGGGQQRRAGGAQHPHRRTGHGRKRHAEPGAILGVGWRRPLRQLVERRRRRNAEVHPLRPANREPAQIVPDVDRTDRRRDVGIADGVERNGDRRGRDRDACAAAGDWGR